MKLKKGTVVFSALALFTALSAGCGNAGQGSGGTENGEETVTLKVWGDMDNQAVFEESFKQVNEAFMEKHPNIKIDYEYAQNLDTLNVAVQSNSLPDLFWVQGNKSTRMEEMANNGYLLPLDEFNIDTSRFPEEAIEYATVDGALYSSPPSFFDYAIVYYNADIFQQHGLDVPTDWAEFESLNQTLADNGVVPIAFGGRGDFDRYWLMQVFGATLFNDVLTGLNEGQTDLDYSSMVAGFDAYRSFAEKGYLGKNYLATDGAGAQLAFTNGQAAMTIDGTWNNNVYEDTSINIGRFALPGEDGTRFAQSGPSNFNTYAVSSKTKHPEEAAEYVRFLTTLESQQIFSDVYGAVPILSDIEPKDEAVQELAAYDEIGNNIYHVFSTIATETSRPQDILLGEVLPQLMTSRITGEEAVELLKAEMDKP